MKNLDRNDQYGVRDAAEIGPQGQAEKHLIAATAAAQVRDVVTPLSFSIDPNHPHPIYDLESFSPTVFDAAFLEQIGIWDIAPGMNEKLLEASHRFQRIHANKALTPSMEFGHADISLEDPLEVHNYTGMCPTFVQELTPSRGACSIGCQYCLVTDGDHQARTTVLDNYPDLVARALEDKKDESAFYYFSPKTEALSEPHLQTGIAHGVLQSFIDHFRRYPESRARLFMATKAGPQHLHFEHGGHSIIELLGQLKGKVQVNGSIGIMPDYLRRALEPNAPSVDERLAALQLCQQAGLFAESVLAQPLILPYLTDEALEEFMTKLEAAGIKNIKPEFLTVDIGNLVALAQFVHHFDPNLIKPLFEEYVGADNQDHIKQRSRVAPRRETSAAYLLKIAEYAKQHGITLSLCNWVKREVGRCDSQIKTLDRESRKGGYQCLGYQTKILK